MKDLLVRSGISKRISSDSESDPIVRARKQVEWANQAAGKLSGVDCPICKNKGVIYCLGEEGDEFVRECKCMAQRRAIARLRKSGLGDLIKRYTFDSWQTPEPWQQRAKEKAQQYAKEHAGWFLASGSPGSGKTHLCTAICAELLKANLETRYLLWRDVAVQAKAAVNDEEEYDRIVGPFKKVEVLYIDDLFKTGNEERDGKVVKRMPTSGDMNLAFEILNSRYNDKSKLTIISTERSIEELLNIDEATGSRIYERSKGFVLDFTNMGNWRLKDDDGERPR